MFSTSLGESESPPSCIYHKPFFQNLPLCHSGLAPPSTVCFLAWLLTPNLSVWRVNQSKQSYYVTQISPAVNSLETSRVTHRAPKRSWNMAIPELVCATLDGRCDTVTGSGMASAVVVLGAIIGIAFGVYQYRRRQYSSIYTR